MRGSLFESISRFLADVLAPFACTGESYVQNSKDVLSRLREQPNAHECILASFDVEALFTSVPVEESLSIISGLLREDESLPSRTDFDTASILTLTRFCLTSCYFKFGDHFYLQSDGVAMGSSLSSVVANIFMCTFEREALASARRLSLTVPKLWLRYVDDVFVLYEGDEHSLNTFFCHVNSCHESITFTKEVEKEGTLPFLDLLIARNVADASLDFTVYRKPTHTNHYLNRLSCHPPAVFRGLVNGLKIRAFDTCSSHLRRRELSH